MLAALEDSGIKSKLKTSASQEQLLLLDIENSIVGGGAIIRRESSSGLFLNDDDDDDRGGKKDKPGWCGYSVLQGLSQLLGHFKRKLVRSKSMAHRSFDIPVL